MMTPASLRSRSPAFTSAITLLISSLRVTTSLLAFPLPPREATLRRCSALAGSCIQQRPRCPVEVPLQRSPLALIKPHWPSNSPTPTFLVLDQLCKHEALPTLGPSGFALAGSCRSSQQLPQAVRGAQCTTKEGCYPQPRKPPRLVLDADGRHCGTTQGRDARHHKPPEILQRALSNDAPHPAHATSASSGVPTPRRT